MKTIILSGGFGTRLSEETEKKPKPMVEIGGKPILWHIMKLYQFYGFSEFILALGYKADIIKKYFLEQTALSGNITIKTENKKSKIIRREIDDWTIHLEDTGLETYTGGRIKKLANLVKNETFMVTYGDGVCNLQINKLLKFHKSHGKLATVTAVRPPARFGGLIINNNKTVIRFTEKPQTGEGWINGGFFVFEPQILKLIKNEKSSLEIELLEYLADKKELMAYCHDGFWQCLDTLRDLRYLESLWNTGNPPWKIWT
jgi:glucose-1-phosphate cytidylyltransferase